MDTATGVISAIAAIASVIVTIVLTRQERKPKELTYQIRHLGSLVTVQEQFQQKVEIIYEGHVVKNLKPVEVEIRNSGKADIIGPQQSYETPITVDFGERASFLTTPSVVKHTANTAQVQPVPSEMNKGTLTLGPVLLNPGSTIIINALPTELEQSFPKFFVEFEGVQVREVKPEPLPDATSWSRRANRRMQQTLLILPAAQAMITYVLGGFTTFTLFGPFTALIIGALYTYTLAASALLVSRRYHREQIRAAQT